MEISFQKNEKLYVKRTQPIKMGTTKEGQDIWLHRIDTIVFKIRSNEKYIIGLSRSQNEENITI